jgi:hypothetical protein
MSLTDEFAQRFQLMRGHPARLEDESELTIDRSVALLIADSREVFTMLMRLAEEVDALKGASS